MLSRKGIFILCCCLSTGFYACQEETTAPKLSEEQLVDILADIHIAEAALQALRGRTKDSMSHLYYEQIYTIHGADSASVQATLEKMRRQPEEMKVIYDQVMERVERLNAKSKDPEAKE